MDEPVCRSLHVVDLFEALGADLLELPVFIVFSENAVTRSPEGLRVPTFDLITYVDYSGHNKCWLSVCTEYMCA
jgi:hypothetical protein